MPFKLDPTNDPNEAYDDVVPAKEAPGWWTVTCNGIPVWHFVDLKKAGTYATNPGYRLSLVTPKLWEKHAGR
jgi:hypothetical protein